MMTHADDFLRAILDAPDDDGPRLLFADWLEENGDPDRAEFIRVQIALGDAGIRSAPPQLWERQTRLLTRHEKEWSAPVRGIASCWTFRRGFIDEVEVEARAFLDGADTLFRRAPVRRLQLVWAPRPWPARSFVPLLAGCPYLERLTGLTFDGNSLGNTGVQALLVTPGLTGLTSLHLKDCQIGDRGARVLADSPLLSRLTTIDLRDNEIGPTGVRALARSLELRTSAGAAPRLRDLLLQGNPLGEAGRRAVQASPLLRRAAALAPPRRFGRAAPDE